MTSLVKMANPSSQYKKSNLMISTPMSNLPFMFSSHLPSEALTSTSSSDRATSEIRFQATSQKCSFMQELSKMGISAKLIPEKNPLKDMKSCLNSPTTGLPFQRRCRSSSPPKEELKIIDRQSNFFFPPRSPVMVSHKIKLREDFTGLGKDSGHFVVEEDEVLRKLKEEYQKMLEGANYGEFECSSEEIGDEGEVEEIEVKIGVNRRRYFK